jgi:hypothetical protein
MQGSLSERKRPSYLTNTINKQCKRLAQILQTTLLWESIQRNHPSSGVQRHNLPHLCSKSRSHEPILHNKFSASTKYYEALDPITLEMADDFDLSETKVLNVLKALDASKATGPDGTQNLVLKRI